MSFNFTDLMNIHAFLLKHAFHPNHRRVAKHGSGYAVRFVKNSVRDEIVFRCVRHLSGYNYTSTQSFTFRNLSYGFQHQFRIRAANMTTFDTAPMVRREDRDAPDCFEETGDEEYCINQPIEFTSKPRDLTIDCSEVDYDHNTSMVSLSWLPPLQINGNLSFFMVTYQPINDTSIVQSLERVFINEKEWNESLSFRFNYTLTDLVYGMVYEISVVPWLDGPMASPSPYHTTIIFDTASSEQPCSVPSSLGPSLTGAPSIKPNKIRVDPILLAGVLGATVLLILIVGSFTYFNKRRLSANEKAVFVRYPDEISTTYSCSIKKDTYNVSQGLDPEVDPVFQKMEFDRSLLKIEEILGSGQFGTVYKGFAYGIDGKEKYIPVAVKSLRENATRSMKEDFLEEIKLIVEIGHHPNILPILGCCTADEPHYLITELMDYGDLLHFLWKCREEKNAANDPIYKMTPTGQLQIAIQIARGMEYLSTTLYYHGDLAARNVLVGKGLICKISDFGLADDIYQRGYKRLAPERKRPVKWVSLETNTQGKCSIQSDVWSFGIVLYEIYTLGGVPYPGMDGRYVISKLQQGYRMERPTMCPEEIYEIMRRCWQENPHHRPSFTVMNNALDAMLTQNVDYLTELEMDFTHYEFVPCQEVDTCSTTWGENETTGKGDHGIISPPQLGKDSKFDAQTYSSEQQISQDSAFSESSALSGELNEIGLWWHWTAGFHEKTSLSAPFPSMEFIPIREYDTDSVHSTDSGRSVDSMRTTSLC
ncbi:fibroblast growth factor receptor 3-like isoform X2 [Lytechinus pictus]|uniref:fibroblast growth factor receptor 3-like isoform X2 n=1 Tax=Lytechinus pictus TaxID=7653 RepID=UPI0030B9B2C3